MNTKQLISNYYRKIVFESSILPMVLVIGGITIVFSIIAFFLRKEVLITLQNRDFSLAKSAIEGFENTAKIIGNSSHSEIALKYSDFAGYRQVVIPWIKADNKIIGFSLQDSNGIEKIFWSRNYGDDLGDHKPSFIPMVMGEIIKFSVKVQDKYNPIGIVTFYSTLNTLHLNDLGLNSLQTQGCKPFDAIQGSFFCPPNGGFSFIVMGFIFVAICIGSLIIVMRSLSVRLASALSEPVEKLHTGLNFIRRGQDVRWEMILPSDSKDIFGPLGNHFSTAAKESQEMKATILSQEKIATLASQVSHDIRSPLAALNLALFSLKNLPEEKRSIIKNSTQRINDIANQILTKSKSHDLKNTKSEEPILLSPLLELVISEIRIQLNYQKHIEIHSHLDHGFDLFAHIDSSFLSRAISNLINNSIEALSMNGGYVSISLTSNPTYSIISVKDNGKGMPTEILKKLISGEKGVTFGKEKLTSGSGLGVYFTKQTVESVGGSLSIESNDGLGSTFIIRLPKANIPDWFVSTINITPNSFLVILDDDETIHQLWKNKLHMLMEENGISILSFSSIDTFTEWKRNQKINQSILYLIDYDFTNQDTNGLDIIDSNSLNNKSFLVTSLFENKNIRSQAIKMGVRILPKGFIPITPIQITNNLVN